MEKSETHHEACKRLSDQVWDMSISLYTLIFENSPEKAVLSRISEIRRNLSIIEGRYPKHKKGLVPLSKAAKRVNNARRAKGPMRPLETEGNK